MPNGVSCAYFAIKNHEVAQKDDNIFREGIAGIQAVRAVDAMTDFVSGLPATSVVAIAGKNKKLTVPPGASLGSTLPPSLQKLGKGLGTLARVGRRLVYPLIAVSGVFNTIKSDDKVKTGFSQALGIGLMYTFESVAERLLCPLTQCVNNSAKGKPILNALWAVARGIAYVGASLSGYELGNRLMGNTIDNIRDKKNQKVKQRLAQINQPGIQIQENSLFSSMKLS